MDLCLIIIILYLLYKVTPYSVTTAIGSKGHSMNNELYPFFTEQKQWKFSIPFCNQIFKVCFYTEIYFQKVALVSPSTHVTSTVLN